METAIAEHLSHVPVFVREIDGAITYWSNGAQELYGYTRDEAVGAVSHELLKTVYPLPLSHIQAILQERGAWDGLLQHTRSDGQSIWVQAHWRLRSPPDRAFVVETCTDVTQRELLSRELAHRVKNTLAIVQSLARFSFAPADKENKASFEARLKALSDANDLLVRRHWECTELGELLICVVRRFDVRDRFTLDGPEVTLTPSAVISYSLAFHELTTNAIKYGALSVPEGRVDVRWTIEQAGTETIHLRWEERDGPPVAAPTVRGFGSRLIERVIASELGAPALLRFEPTGLVCEIEGPLQKAPWPSWPIPPEPGAIGAAGTGRKPDPQPRSAGD